MTNNKLQQLPTNYPREIFTIVRIEVTKIFHGLVQFLSVKFKDHKESGESINLLANKPQYVKEFLEKYFFDNNDFKEFFIQQNTQNSIKDTITNVQDLNDLESKLLK